MIEKVLFKKTPYDLDSLAKIMEAAYSEPPKVEHIQKKTFSPSIIGYGHGQCPRYWYLAFNGADFTINHDSSSIDSMQSGTDRHERIQNNFAGSELEVELEKEIKNEDPPIRGFADLIIKNFNGVDIPVEIKTTRMEAYSVRKTKREPASYHEIQLLIYMTILNLKYGLFLYENKNDHDKLLIPLEMTESNRQKVEAVFDWMRKVYALYKNNTAPEIPYKRKNSKVCKGCPLNDYCHDQPNGEVVVGPLNYEDIQSESGW